MEKDLAFLLDRRHCYEKRTNEVRTDGLIDSARILHSFAFRRLQGKRQVLGIEQGDFHRTRLTHSSEVASISRGIAEVIFDRLNKTNREFFGTIQPQLLIQEQKFKLLISRLLNDQKNFLDSLRAISMAHDIGHPPFGHGGELALNYVMRKFGGFEGNAQNISLVDRIEEFNLSRQTVLGIIKYPVELKLINCSLSFEPTVSNPHIGLSEFSKKLEENKSIIKGYYHNDEAYVLWAFNNNKLDFEKFSQIFEKNDKIKSFDCSIMDIADDISNAIHDLEDGINLDLIDKQTFDLFIEQNRSELMEFFEKNSIQDEIKNLSKNFFSVDKKSHFGFLIDNLTKSIQLVKNDEDFENPLLQYRVILNSAALKLIEKFKKLVMDQIIKSQEVQVIEYGGARAIIEVFNAIEKNPNLLPAEKRKKFNDYSEAEQKRVVCDYIAGMTDNYLLNLHKKLTGIDSGSVFDRL